MSALTNFRRYLRELKYTLNGRRISELRAELATNKAAESQKFGVFEIQDSVSRLAAPILEDKTRLAVISCMPPAQTGIATASYSTFLESPFPIDIFAHYENPADYLAAVTDRRLEESKVRVFHIASLPLALQKIRYNGQLFVLGNSSHNLPIYDQLCRANCFPSLMPTFIHLHDPCLLNLLSMSCAARHQDFGIVVEHHYGIRPANDRDHDALVRAGVFGVRPLLHRFDINGIFVNSRAAQKILARECPGSPIQVLFHPVFPMAGASPKRSQSALRIGTFGEPNNGKRTALVTMAFEVIKARDPAARLVVAGFGASRYAAQHGLTIERGYEVHDDIGEEQLCQLMQSVDVAVQLRLQNLGETSGVVSRLMNTETPTIVSKIGSFEEFGNAVTFFDDAKTANDLAALIVDLSSNRPAQFSRREYASRRSPRMFCEELAVHIAGGANVPEDAAQNLRR